MEIVGIVRESCPAARLIGKKYTAAPDWGEWWEKGWFDILESAPRLDFNGDACLDAMKAQGFARREDDWCIERYACPNWTTPDADGRVILDYAIAIK